jgi:predicted Zn-dependent protease
LLLVTGKPKPALRLLNDYIRHRSPTADIYQLIAEAHSKAGNEAESQRYVAESYYAKGQTKAAILQLRLAQKAAGDNFYLNAVIDERLAQWQAEYRARKENE